MSLPLIGPAEVRLLVETNAQEAIRAAASRRLAREAAQAKPRRRQLRLPRRPQRLSWHARPAC